MVTTVVNCVRCECDEVVLDAHENAAMTSGCSVKIMHTHDMCYDMFRWCCIIYLHVLLHCYSLFF